MKRTLALAALLALGSAAFAPLPAAAQARVNVVIGAPPPPIYERVPVARRGYIWSQGHWEWNGRRHHWVPGIWIAERPGYAYSAPVWYQDRGRWQMRPAAWTRGGYGPGPGRDRDRDGIPDRFERPRHDRDHDGVPNRYDRHPNNPYRN